MHVVCGHLSEPFKLTCNKKRLEKPANMPVFLTKVGIGDFANANYHIGDVNCSISLRLKFH